MRGETRLFLLVALAIALGLMSAPVAAQEVTNSIGMKFVLAPAGSFTMGVDLSAENGVEAETPQRQVTLTRPFYLGVYEVTQAEYSSVMDGASPGVFKGRDLPVENVSWDDARAFLRKLNQKEGTDKYRLPTEAEWEYSARAGTTTAYFFGSDAKFLGDYAWFAENSGGQTRPVGGKKPNPWGFYDLYGNVWEWTEDFYGKYQGDSATDPGGPSAGSERTSRGCSWSNAPVIICRSAARVGLSPELRDGTLGFRVAFTAED
ncbi:MAG: formylglycine-generating enzyme family protein [Deltaproteobacteria bacterium]|nr:formylglycine-generating enzyme family protein [Deltaproteobacteria bacterium]